MVIQDFAVFFVLFIFADIIFYMVVMKGLLVTSITGRSPNDPAPEPDGPAFTLELRHSPPQPVTGLRRFRDQGAHGGARGNLAEQTVDFAAVVRQELQHLNLEKVHFTPPYGLRVGEPALLEMGVTQNVVEGVTRALNEVSPANITTLRIGALMRVNLHAENCVATPLNLVEQRLHPNQVATWAWELVPMRAGDKKLGFDIALNLKTANGEGQRTYSWSGGEVEVGRNPAYGLRRFMKRRWKALLVITLAAASGLGYGIWQSLP